jgi:hypothetical protein
VAAVVACASVCSSGCRKFPQQQQARVALMRLLGCCCLGVWEGMGILVSLIGVCFVM